MRVAYLVSQYPATSHTFIHREIQAMRARGIEIETLSIRTPAAEERSDPDSRQAFEGSFYVLPASPTLFLRAHAKAVARHPLRYLKTLRLALSHRVPGARALVWAVLHFVESIVVADRLERRRIDHLHCHFANSAATVGMLAAAFAAVRWSLTLHGISETDYPAGLLLGRKIAAVDFAACASWFIRAQAMRVTPASQWKKLIVVRCGLDLATLGGTKRASDGLSLICVGRLSAEKGQAGLLQALATVRNAGLRARLTIVGSGPEEEALRVQCKSLDLGDAVAFAGRLDERTTLDRIADADALILPSFLEGLPVVLMEAMALGVPVIASRIAGIPELIEDGSEGLLFRPGDWDDLSAKMQRLLSDAILRERLAAAAQAKVAREFEINTAIAPLVERMSASVADHGS